MIEITFGHGKENNRAHSKQLQLSLVSVGPGMPVLGQVLSGNSSDMTWNFEMLSRQLDAEDTSRGSFTWGTPIADLRWRFISHLPSVYTLGFNKPLFHAPVGNGQAKAASPGRCRYHSAIVSIVRRDGFRAPAPLHRSGMGGNP